MFNTLSVLPAHRLAWGRCDGQVVGDDVMAMLAQLVEHPDWTVGGDLVMDFSQGRSLVLDLHDLQQFGRFADTHMDRIGTGGTTVIVSADPLVRTIGELFIVQRRAIKKRLVQTARTLAEAEAMLGLPPGLLTPPDLLPPPSA